MLLDLENLFSNDQDLTAIANASGAAASTNIVDFGAAGTPHQAYGAMAYDKSTGTWKPILVQITTTCTSGGSATLTVAVQVDNDSAFGSAQTLYTSAAIAVASLTAGYRFLIDKLPPLTATQRADSRYMRLTYDVNTADMTAGTITAGFVGGLQTNFS